MSASQSLHPKQSAKSSVLEKTGKTAGIKLPVIVRHLPTSLLIAFLIFGLAWTVQLLRGPVIIDVGAANALDNLYLDEGSHLDSDTNQDKGYGGFFAAEVQPDKGASTGRDLTFRWSERTSYIKLLWPLEAEPLKATLLLAAPRPDLPPDKIGTTLKVTQVLDRDETVLASQLAITGQPHEYSFVIPYHLKPDLAAVRLRFDAASDFQPGKGDSRHLSLIFYRLTLAPDYGAFGWQGWLASLARPGLLAVLAFFSWAIASLAFRRRHISLICEGVAGVVLIFSLIWWATAAEPYYAAWAFVLPLAWLFGWLGTVFTSRAPNLPAPFIYAATLFPVLPIVQFALGRLNLYGINPASVTFEVYIGALLFSAGMYVRYNLLGPSQPAQFEQAFVRAVVLAAVVSFLYNHFFVWQTNLYRGADFKVYYYALQNYEAGKPLYDLAAVLNHPGDAVRVPPTFGFLVWPFVHVFTFNVELALAFWRAINELLFVPVVLVMLKVFGGIRNQKYFTAAVLFMCLSYNQVAETVAYGQFNIIMLLGLALTMLWTKQKRDTGAGIALALPIGIKLIPILWAAFWPLEKRWRGWFGLGLGGAVISGLAALAVGWDNIWFYLTKVVFGVNHPEITISNQALFGFLGRLSVPLVMDDYKGRLAAWVTLAGYGGAVALTLLTLWIIWRRRDKDSRADLLKLSALNLLMLIIPPFVWFHYDTLALVSLLTLLVWLGEQPLAHEVARWQLLLFGLAFAMLAYGGRNDFFFTQAVGLARLGSSYRFMAVVALWSLNLWYIWKNQKPYSNHTDIKDIGEKVALG